MCFSHLPGPALAEKGELTMNTIIHYSKSIAKKVVATMSLVAMIIIKTIFKVLLAVYRLAVIPFVVFCLINSIAVFFGTPLNEALISLGLGGIALVLYYILPATLPILDRGIARLIRIVRRPLVYKSRLPYTFG